MEILNNNYRKINLSIIGCGRISKKHCNLLAFYIFFNFQYLMKENITFKNTKTLLKKILQVSIIFIKNTISFRI